MRTAVNELLEIEHPILLSGMSWISTPKLVAAVSEAGGLGILASGPLSPDETREAIHESSAWVIGHGFFRQGHDFSAKRLIGGSWLETRLSKMPTLAGPLT